MSRIESNGSHTSKLEKSRLPGVRIDEVSLHDRIAEKAYELYEQRGRLPGRELQDWLEAETSVRAERGQRRTAVPQPVHR